MRPVTDVSAWLRTRDGIAHRDELLREGFSVRVLRDAVRAGRVGSIRRAWLSSPEAAPDLVTAARAGGRVSCVSLARRRGWWMPERVDARIHLHMTPGSGSARLAADEATLHWTVPLTTRGHGTLTAAVEDALAHIATCLPFDAALVLWESATRLEGLAPEYLRAVRWRSVRARELAEAVTGLSDSGLETLAVLPLRRAGLAVRQQVKIAGRFVDLLVGERLVVQLDGHAFHSTSADRSRDIAHDAELRLRGYTVLRFSYAQVVHDWRGVESVIRRAVAAGLHVAR